MKQDIVRLIKKTLQNPDMLIKLLVVLVIFVILLDITLVLMKYIKRKKEEKYNRDDLIVDDMDGLEFEKFCADLLEKKGFEDVNITKASGDFGVDILAEKDGVTYAIQCKRYSDSVGVKAVQEAYAGKEFYDRMVGAVLTNQYFTQPAVDAAKKLKILLWDRGYMEGMLEEKE